MDDKILVVFGNKHKLSFKLPTAQLFQLVKGNMQNTYVMVGGGNINSKSRGNIQLYES